MNTRTNNTLRDSLIIALALLIAPVSAAADVSNQNATYRHTTTANLAAMTGLFNAAAQEYANNTVKVPWNVANSNVAIQYAPFLIYAGSNPSSCAPPTGSGATVSGSVNLVGQSNGSVSYLPSSWSPPVSGTFCAVVWVNSPYATEMTVQSYFVPSSSASVQNTINSQTAMNTQYLTYNAAKTYVQQYSNILSKAGWNVLYSANAKNGSWSSMSSNGSSPVTSTALPSGCINFGPNSPYATTTGTNNVTSTCNQTSTSPSSGSASMQAPQMVTTFTLP